MQQQGVMLLEAIIGLLIFAVGALAMLALQASAIAVQSDAQYRIEAANFAQRMLGEIVLNVDRTNNGTIAASLAAFAHQTVTSPTDNCSFSGGASNHAAVTAWATALHTTPATRLPGTTSSMLQITVDTATFNEVEITICWQGAEDKAKRRHVLRTYIN